MPRGDRIALWALRGLAVYGGLVAVVVGVLNFAGEGDPDKRAIVAMGLGLIVIWCILGGVTMRLLRDRLVGWAKRIRVPWRVRFVLLCIVMALIEEAVTTSLTNAGPLLGAATDAARITSSANYLHVVAGRIVDGEYVAGSVVAFIPWFLCWAWLLGRYDFKPAEVMLLFGLTGTLAETLTFGPSNLAGVGMWVYVYGLMIYLPVYTVPPDRGVRPVRWWHWPLAVLLPLVFIIPFAIYVIFAIVRKAASSIRAARASHGGR